VKLVTAAEKRELEQRAVEAGTSVESMMEAAGLAVAQEAWLSLGVVAERPVLVLVGPGNNGGDGLVAARHLAEWGADVTVYMLSPRPEGDANLARVREMDVPTHVATDDADFALLDQQLQGAELIVDALLGTGRARPIEGGLASILERVQTARERPARPRVIAVDVPTGVDADTGRADGLAVDADHTVTFGFSKVGLHMLPGSDRAGAVEVVDIGLPADAAERLRVELIDTPWVRRRLPERPRRANKGTFGRVLVVAGSQNYVGAARLAAEGCYRAGAGLVTIACTREVQRMVAPALSEATYVPLDERDGAIARAAVDVVVDALAAYDVLLIGPGLSQAGDVPQFVIDVLSRVPEGVRGCVVDADALNALAKTSGWQERIARPCVLTPHPGEMSRLRGTSINEIQDDRLRAAMDAAAEWGQTVVLKGAHTVVAAPDGRAAISPHANPLLASAGTGDVLAGAIAGLIGQGMEPFEAAACGVYVHGFAAEECGRELGDRGLLAGDLLPALPRAIKVIREGRAASAPLRGGDLGGFDLAALLGARQDS
jgi:NAD(P)H-hydrate epimerase